MLLHDPLELLRQRQPGLLLYFLAGNLHKQIKQAGMLTDAEMPAVRIIVRGAVGDRDGVGPLDVGPRHPPIIAHELDGVGEDEQRAFLSVLHQNGVGGMGLEPVTVIRAESESK